MKKALISMLLSMAMGTLSVTFAADTLAWDKTFSKSAKVTHEKVSYYNRYGINIVADLYLPKNIDMAKKNPAIIVAHPFGGVKEQTSGLYAQTMAERGFVTLAYDASFGGESGGQPRSVASPEIYVEDFSAAVDFLGTREFVDKERIGVIGICGSGGFSLSAAAVDPRLKAVVTISMYDMGRATRQGLGDTMTMDERKKALQDIADQRYVEFLGGQKRYGIGTPEVITEDSPAVAKEFYAYYRGKRGFHPRSTTATTVTSGQSLMNFFPFAQIETISPRPILFIAGEVANSRYFSEDAYKLAAQPKEIHIVKGAGHVDLYDGLNYIPFDKINDFFSKNLK